MEGGGGGGLRGGDRDRDVDRRLVKPLTQLLLAHLRLNLKASGREILPQKY